MKVKAFLLATLFGVVLFGCKISVDPGEETGAVGKDSAAASLSGKAVYVNAGDNSSICITLDKTDGLRTAEVLKSLGKSDKGIYSVSGDGVSAARAVVAYSSCAADGSFTFKNLEPGVYTVYASSPDSQEKAVCRNITIAANENKTLSEQLKLTATGSLSGKITLDSSASGNSGFTVFIGGTSFMAKTGSSGDFTITGIPAGTGYEIFIEKGTFSYFWKTADVTAFETGNLESRNFTTEEIIGGSLKTDGFEVYTIAYELNGGYFAEEPDYIHFYGVSTALLKKPVKEDFVFNGWYLTEDFSDDEIFYISSNNRKNITVYAKWIPVSILNVSEVSSFLNNLNINQTIYIYIKDLNPDFEVLRSSIGDYPDIIIDLSLTEITEIPEYAFEECSGLTSITIPDGVVSINSLAFSGCKGLTSITIPDGVVSINSSAFSYCSGLTSITIPDSVKTIEWYAFEGCTSLTQVNYTGTELQWAGITISRGDNAPLLNANITFNYTPPTGD